MLMLELTGARLVDGTVDVGGPGPDAKTIRLRDEKVTRLLGTEVPLGARPTCSSGSSSASTTAATTSRSRCPRSGATTSRARST